MHPQVLRTLSLLTLGLAATAATTASAADPVSDPGAIATVSVDSNRPRTEVVVVHEQREVGRIRHRHRLHIDTDLFAWRRWTEWRDDGNDDNDKLDSLSILGGVPLFGAPGGVLGPVGNVKAGYAYGVTDRFVLGFRLGLGWQRLQAAGSDSSGSVLSATIVLYFEFVFRPRHAVRPYLGARFGVGGSALTDRNGDDKSSVGTIGPILGASAGLHAFITERVSLDPAITFDYHLIYARSKSGGMSTDFENQARSPNVALALGLSVWLGRDRKYDHDEARRRARARMTAAR